MNPQQPDPPRGEYDFIVNPNAPIMPQKAGGLGGTDKGPIFKFFGILIGGAILLVTAGVVLANVFLADKTNVNDLVTVAQYQTEIIRLSDEKDTFVTAQSVKNAAITTTLAINTQKQENIEFLRLHNRKLPPAEAKLKKDPATDKQLTLAKETSTYDSTYTKVMREILAQYSRALTTARENSISNTENAMLSKHYDQTQTLLKQWPAE